MGLDIGKVNIGMAISNREFNDSKGFKHLILQSGIDSPYYPTYDEDFSKNTKFYYQLNRTITENHVKALIVGYPLLKHQQTKHSYFIEKLMKYIYKQKLIHCPCTFINEDFSTIQAVKLLEIDQMNRNEDTFNKDYIHNKKLKDKAAATIILNRFLVLYNTSQDELELNAE